MERRLAAILAADVVGYSRLMEADEAGTLAKLKSHRDELVDPTIAEHHGRIVKLMGDGMLVEFTSAVDAVRCAISLQEGMAARETDVPEEKRTVFRIGINMGDVIVEEGDIFGDGVNVAARLEGMADPGGLLISQSVRDSVANQLDAAFFDNGERKFKNIARPIRVWSWPRQLSASRAEGKPRVFVADFQGRGEEEARLADDLADELRAHLARLTGIEIATDRGKARYVAEGSVRLAAGRSRVFARLIAVEGDRQIWSDRYDEDTDDPFDVLDRSAPRMAMSVRRRVAADDAERLANRNLDELSLEELLALAGVSFFTPTKAGWRGGGEIAEQALELDPKNFMALAMASAGLGLAEYLYGFRKPEDAVVSLAFRRIAEGLRLNSRSDMLHVTHAGLLLYSRRRHRDSAASVRRSLELNPEYNMGLWLLGATQVFAGECDAGVESAARAVNIDIRDPYVHLYSRIVAYGHLGAGRYDEAADWFQKADQLAPGLPPNLMGLAVSHWLDGEEDGARDAVARLMEEEPEFRLGETHPLPYRDDGMWARSVETLRRAGAPG
ncbi:MAG: adenylate/guanylate cyclase domain-containing protein [Alphaproteobacteria bacterium]